MRRLEGLVCPECLAAAAAAGPSVREVDGHTLAVLGCAVQVPVDQQQPATAATRSSLELKAAASAGGAQQHPGALKFVDRDEHVYFWFPLLAGLSELTFDPRPEIRRSALEVRDDVMCSLPVCLWVSRGLDMCLQCHASRAAIWVKCCDVLQYKSSSA